jgi:hypothetical protein
MEALAKQGDEVVGYALSIEDLELVAEPIYHKVEVVALQGKVVGAEVLERILGVSGCDW